MTDRQADRETRRQDKSSRDGRGGKRRNGQDRRFTVILAAACILAAVLSAVILLWPQESVPTDSGYADDREESDGTVVWNGREYVYNDHLSNYLFLGVDRREVTETQAGQTDAGQADALFLLSRDRVTGDLTLISIPRDTMTPVEVIGPDGTSLGVSEDHISLSYGYGDGGHESCRLTREAVSALLYGLPVQGYCAVRLNALPVLMEAVGELNVTVPNDSLRDTELAAQEGDTVLLDQDNIETFVRYRDIDETGSAMERLERQQAFLAAWYDAFREKAAADAGSITDLYGALEPYLTTNMDSGEFADIMEDAAGTQIDTWTVPGENVEGDYYDEYHVDDSALYEKVLETFYISE